MSDEQIINEIEKMLNTSLLGTTTASVKISSKYAERCVGATIYRFAGGPGKPTLRSAIIAYLQRGKHAEET